MVILSLASFKNSPQPEGKMHNREMCVCVCVRVRACMCACVCVVAGARLLALMLHFIVLLWLYCAYGGRVLGR